MTSCEPKWWLDVYRRSETWLNAYGFKLKLSDAFQNASLVRRQVFNKVKMTIYKNHDSLTKDRKNIKTRRFPLSHDKATPHMIQHHIFLMKMSL